MKHLSITLCCALILSSGSLRSDENVGTVSLGIASSGFADEFGVPVVPGTIFAIFVDTEREGFDPWIWNVCGSRPRFQRGFQQSRSAILALSSGSPATSQSSRSRFYSRGQTGSSFYV